MFRIILAVSVCLMVFVVEFNQEMIAGPTGEPVSFLHDGKRRDYRIYVPESIDTETPTALVVCLHGGGGNSAQCSRMGLSSVADQHGFIAVYPNAIDKHWNDGRKTERFAEHDKTIDDVAFIRAIVDRVSKEHEIDSGRVFAMGMSNGGFMTQRLAMEHPEIFSAAGIVIASMGEALKEQFNPRLPVSVLYMNGTEDPLVPYDGGAITVNAFPKLAKRRGLNAKSRGRCISTDDAVALWVDRNGIKTKPVVTKLDDVNAADGCNIELNLWEGGELGTAVALYKVIGGGHSIPGGTQYLPKGLIGQTNQDIGGFEVIWQFFEQYNRHAETDGDTDTETNGETDGQTDRNLPWVTREVKAPGIEFQVFESEIANSNVSYHIYVPPIYAEDETTRLPVLYWLHGTMGGVAGIQPLARHFETAMADGSMPPMLVVFVNGLPKRLWCDSKDGSSPVESVFVKDLISQVDRHYRTVATREGRILEGFSMGGFGAARIGLKHPDLFTGVSILGGGPLDPNFQGPRARQNVALRREILQTVCENDMDYFRAEHPTTLANKNAAEVLEKLAENKFHIRVAVGEQDKSLADNRQFHVHLEKLDISHEFIVLPNVKHDTRAVLTGLATVNGDFYGKALQKTEQPDKN